MFTFFLKKNFLDHWENLLFLMVFNAILTLLLGAFAFLIYKASEINQNALPIAFVLCGGIFMIFVFAGGANACKIADFSVPSFSLFFRSLKNSILPGFVFGVGLSAFLMIVYIAFNFYFRLIAGGNLIGVFFCALIAWFTLIVLMAMQWFIPLYYLQEDNTLFKCLKKSFIIYFDNASFTFVMLIHNIIVLFFTVFTFGFIPGINGLTLSCMNALRLRLYKYDWLEEHKDYLDDKDKRSEVPWELLIQEDRESLGPFKLSSILAPWKSWK